MVLEFSIKNTFSIKEEQTISFEAIETEPKDTELHTITYGGKKFLKLACIYGANASGKTKIAEALNFYLDFMTQSFTHLEPNEPIYFFPFKFDLQTINQPGEFHLVFYAKDFNSEVIVRYEYYLALNEKEVVAESLYYSPKGQRKLIFERKIQGDIKWGTGITGVKKVISELTRQNCSVISAGAQAKHSVFLHIYNYIENRFTGLLDFTRNSLSSFFAERIETDSDFKEKAIKILSYSDVGAVSDIHVVKHITLDELAEILSDARQKKGSKRNEKPINRQVNLVHHYGSDVELPLYYESAGTKKIMELTLPLIDIIQNPSLCLIDELEASLHQELLEMFILLFLEASSESQLLFTTHNQELLDSDLLRDDEIWFCNKTVNGDSLYSSITDYKGIRKETSRKKLYKADKFGALPNIDINGLRELFCAKKDR